MLFFVNWSFLGKLVLTILIGAISFYLVRFILRVRSLPPGPLPLPIVGNLLAFRSSKGSRVVFSDFRRRYGNIWTVWLGCLPFVVVSSYDLIKEATLQKKTDFDGRFQFFLMRCILQDGGSDIAMVDPGPQHDVLRKIGHSAIRKYAPSENLSILVRSVLEDVSKDFLSSSSSSEEEETGHEINAKEYILLMVYNITSFSAFKSRYDKNDEDYLNLKATHDKVREMVAAGFVGDFLPILRPFFWKREKVIENRMRKGRQYIAKTLMEHKQTYKRGVVRDFTDAVISSKEDALAENSSSLRFMTDQNLCLVISDLFNAGIDTTQTSICWILLYLLHFPEIRSKVVSEIDQYIGDRIPVQEDRRQCHYTWAVISEMFRLRAPGQFGLPHKTIRDTQLGGYKIPAGTGVLFDHDTINKEASQWTEPEVFRPERFLDDQGQHVTTRFPNFTPFGMGRRSCIGETLARQVIFLILVGLFQKYEITLPNDYNEHLGSLLPKPIPGLTESQDYHIILNPRNTKS